MVWGLNGTLHTSTRQPRHQPTAHRARPATTLPNFSIINNLHQTFLSYSRAGCKPIDRIRSWRTMSSPTPSTPPLPLPRVDGPKLEPYGGTAAADIDFIRYIGTGDDADSEVWKVSINGQLYALKIVSADKVACGSVLRHNKLTRKPISSLVFLSELETVATLIWRLGQSVQQHP